MEASIFTIKASISGFMPTKESLTTFLFDNNDIHSNKNTVNEGNVRANRDTTDDNNNKTGNDGFYGTAI